MGEKVTRRQFVTVAAGTAAGFMIVPRHVLGRGFQAPSDLVNVAAVGINGQGAANTRAVMSQNVVAICDVDDSLLAAKLAQWRTQAQTAAARQTAAGAGAAPPPQAPPPASPFRDFGPSKAQLAADARFPREDTAASLQRFVDQQLPRLQRYRDYREMLDKQKDIDAVIVATPDHMHAVIASAAMDLGKHVYVQKPLCWSVFEARHLARKAATSKVVTQMGNQLHSTDGRRRAVEYILNGAIGDVREVHVWTNRPIWPQGIPRPTPPSTAARPVRWTTQGVMQQLGTAMSGAFPVPEQLSWDLFLGVAPDVEYHPLYHPFNWRGWIDWGQGALGDMGAHLIDFPVWALDLGLPTSIETVSSPFNGASYPAAAMTYYEFPARGKRDAVQLTWYDGGFMPSTPPELGDGQKLTTSGGVLYVGSKGKLLQDEGGAVARLLPARVHNEKGPPKERLSRVPYENHEMNWIHAIRGLDTISSPFDVAAHLTEIMLLGVVSLRAGSKISYDGANMRVTNNTAPRDANQFLTREYRAGYRL